MLRTTKFFEELNSLIKKLGTKSRSRKSPKGWYDYRKTNEMVYSNPEGV